MMSLPETWRTIKLGELCAPGSPIVYGIIQPGPDVAAGIPYVRPTELIGDGIDIASLRKTTPQIAAAYERSSLKPGDIILAIVGTIGKLAIVPSELADANITQSSARIRPPGWMDPRYLAFALKSPALHEQYNEYEFGVAVRRLNIAHVRDLNLPLAPLNEQCRIVAKLEALSARSRRAKEALDAIPPLLERFRQSVLAAAFRGDLTADWREKHPDVEPAEVLLQRIRAERRRRWEEAELARMKAKGKAPGDDRWKERYEEPAPVDASELPELPEGWCWASWAEIGFCQNGRPFPSSDYSTSGIKLLRPGNLHVDGGLEWTTDNTKYLPERHELENPDHIIQCDELVMNLTAQSLKDEFLGRVCLSARGERCLLNQRLARLTPVELSARFCLWLFKAPLVRGYIDELNTGSLIQHMFTSQVERFALPIPPAAEQAQIVTKIESMLSTMRRIRESVQEGHSQLGNLDRSILAKAFRGELVPQDPSDEPASVLLERLRAERAAADAGAGPARRAGRKRKAPSPAAG